MSGLVLPADGATKPLHGQKMESFIKSLYVEALEDLQRAEEELRAGEERIVKLLTAGGALVGTLDPQCQQAGLSLIVAGCWILKKKKERENETSPPWPVREHEPTGMDEATTQGPHEPALKKMGREDEPPSRLRTMVKAPNEPTMQEKGREDEPPRKSQEKANVGTQEEKITGGRHNLSI